MNNNNILAAQRLSGLVLLQQFFMLLGVLVVMKHSKMNGTLLQRLISLPCYCILMLSLHIVSRGSTILSLFNRIRSSVTLHSIATKYLALDVLPSHCRLDLVSQLGGLSCSLWPLGSTYACILSSLTLVGSLCYKYSFIT